MSVMFGSDFRAERRGDVLCEGLREADGELWIVNPTYDSVSQFVYAFYGEPNLSPSVTPIRLLATRDLYETLTEDFLLAGLAADLVADDVLETRVLSSAPRHSVLVTAESVVSLVECEGCVSGLTTTETAPVTATREGCESRWEAADSYSFRTPALSTVRETLRAELNPEVATEFDRALAALDSDHEGPGLGPDSPDEVVIALLVAASTGQLLYDIGRWGEAVRLASKATFSRSKNRLQDVDLLDTQKVPINVGRPRLRLVFGDALSGQDIESAVRHARSVLG